MRARRSGYSSEAEMAAACMQTMTDRGWTMYPEVGGIDLIAERRSHILAIECKMALCWKVVEQAWERRKRVDGVLVCVPCPGYLMSGYSNPVDEWRYVSRSHPLMATTMHHHGIGLIVIGEYRGKPAMRIARPATVVPRESQELSGLLVPEAQTHTVPGLPSCRRWSHWDVLELAYVAEIRKRSAFASYSRSGSLRLEDIVAVCEPHGLRKDGRPLQKTLDRAAALILNRRWRRLRLQDGCVSVVESSPTPVDIRSNE